MKKPLHKLLTRGSNKQYLVDGRSAIEEMEKEFTVDDMISFCLVNIFKYKFREKGVNAEDDYKVSKYRDYLEELYALQSNLLVSDAWNLLGIEWDYGT